MNSRRRWLSFATVAGLLATLAPVSTSVPTATADALPPVAIVIRGKGNGHGRGMSQYGALGWATKLNATWTDIINFYYGGSGRTLGTLGPGDANAQPGGVMSVRLITHDGKQTAVVSDNKTAQWAGRPGTY
jgi:hypothetical protein